MPSPSRRAAIVAGVVGALLLLGQVSPGDPALTRPLRQVTFTAASGGRATVLATFADGSVRPLALVSATGTALPITFLPDAGAPRLVGLDPITLGVPGAPTGDHLLLLDGPPPVAVVLAAPAGELRAYRVHRLTVVPTAPGQSPTVRATFRGPAGWDLETPVPPAADRLWPGAPAAAQAADWPTRQQ